MFELQDLLNTKKLVEIQTILLIWWKLQPCLEHLTVHIKSKEWFHSFLLFTIVLLFAV